MWIIIMFDRGEVLPKQKQTNTCIYGNKLKFYTVSGPKICEGQFFYLNGGVKATYHSSAE